MFSDPLSVTFNGSSKSLPRIETWANRTVYRTADGEFQISIWDSESPQNKQVAGKTTTNIELARRIPDPTPTNSFDDWRQISNAFRIGYSYDTSHASLGDLDLLRAALLALVDATFQGRLITGEK